MNRSESLLIAILFGICTIFPTTGFSSTNLTADKELPDCADVESLAQIAAQQEQIIHVQNQDRPYYFFPIQRSQPHEPLSPFEFYPFAKIDPRAPAPDFILVSKTLRKLYLLAAGELLGSYHSSFGPSPVGHKTREGDGRTPEGLYQISRKNPHSRFRKALQISYPNAQDIRRAKAAGVNPGGMIMIHGFPEDPTYRSVAEATHKKAYWTRGCVAVTDEEIDEIYHHVKVETPIRICK